MLLKHAALVLSAAQALLALASPANCFTVQDSSPYPASNHSHCGEGCDPQLTTSAAPEVHLDDAVFVGIEKGVTHQYLGIPFAQPPIGDLRLRQPKALPPYSDLYFAQRFGRSCPQQKFTIPTAIRREEDRQNINNVLNLMYGRLVPDDEDCLTINVVKPSFATPISKLPVVVWIFGGAFQIGGTSTYDGANVVSRSMDLGQPIIYVSMNYRLSALGFLPGKEVKKAGVGNLGLQDQRLALNWVQTYITEFGGDPGKVTIWGESAGAISVSMHMLTNKGNQKGLFRGAIMQSGGPIPVGDIEDGQVYYDSMVENTRCGNATDTLECLRHIPYTTFKYAMDRSPDFMSYSGLILPYLPRVDGVFLTEPPQYAVLRGHVSKVPMITGNCDDEATLFSFSTSNLTTTADVRDYLKLYMMPRASEQEIDFLLRHYPNDQRAGSPFDTGIRNVFSPQFKRIAALQGDFVFHGPRRFFLKHMASKLHSWAFLFKRGKNVPFIGSAHATDLMASISATDIFLGELRDYVIRFVNFLDPNGGTGPGVPWPRWDPRRPRVIVFQDPMLFPIGVAEDNYRTDALNFVANLSLIYPI